MITIVIPDNNINERKYIVDVMFNEFLGVEYKIEKKDIQNYEIFLENNKKLVIIDAFFSKYKKKLEYLNINNIPSKVKFTDDQFNFSKNMPIIYGKQLVNITENEIHCYIDIFASSFFMLTRWEEYVHKGRDEHNRFPVENSLAFKNLFLDIPVVNEYICLLKNILLEIKFNGSFLKRKYEKIITHDIDHIYMWDTKKKFFLHILRDLIRKKSLKDFVNSVNYYAKVKKNIVNDPYDTFDYLMSLSEKNKIKSYFFFMGEGLSKEYDNQYKSDSVSVRNTVKNIKKRGHFIGLHPSYYAYNIPEQFKKEKIEIEKNLEVNITFGREHYLRFDIPKTWQIWEDNGMEWGSSMNYSGQDGFRCGICYPFSVFNILTQKKLFLKERPLIVMDVNQMLQKDMSPEKMKKNIEKLNNTVKKYQGEFVFLWHNSSFNTDKWRIYQNTYASILNEEKI
jgi:hypothetical protein